MNRNTKILIVISALLFGAVFIYYGFFYDELGKSKAQWDSYKQNVAQLNDKSDELAKLIKEVQGNSYCEADVDCHIIGLGSKSCDEFTDFLIYSTQDANEPKLLKLVTELNQIQEKLNDKSLKVNKCGIKPAPVVCRNQRCVPKLQ